MTGHKCASVHFCTIVARDDLYYVDCSECHAVAGFRDAGTAEAFATSHEDTTDREIGIRRGALPGGHGVSHAARRSDRP